MAANVKNKEIQVQKPAQSLQAFQKNLDAGPQVETGVLKPVAIGVAVVVIVVVAFFGFRIWRASGAEKFEAALSEVVRSVQGEAQAQVAPQDLEKRMREALPRLEALARTAPSARRGEAEALVATWRLELEGKGAVPSVGQDAWGRLRIAQKALALGKDAEVVQALAPLRKEAGPDAPWASLFWDVQIELDRLQGNREQAWKDLAEFKGRFKEKGDASRLEKVIQGI